MTSLLHHEFSPTKSIAKVDRGLCKEYKAALPPCIVKIKRHTVLFDGAENCTFEVGLHIRDKLRAFTTISEVIGR